MPRLAALTLGLVSNLVAAFVHHKVPDHAKPVDFHMVSLLARQKTFLSRLKSYDSAIESIFHVQPEIVKLSVSPTEASANALRFWNKRAPNATSEGCRAPKKKAMRYLTFESDGGGFNNMRMAFEYFVDLAIITGRTLVMPPPEGWYLMDWGAVNIKDKSDPQWLPGNTTSTYDEFWDLEFLGKHINVISAQDFFHREKEHYNIPDEVNPGSQRIVNTPDRGPWKDWLLTHATIVGNCGDAERTLNSDHELVHFPYDLSRANYRFFECSTCGSDHAGFAAPRTYEASDCCAPGSELLHYNPKMFDLAAIAVNSIGFAQYTALHLRRNDFQYHQAPSAEQASPIFDQLTELLAPGEAVYVASDEIEAGWFQGFKAVLASKGHDMYSLKDFLPQMESNGYNKKWSGLVEQLICAGGRVFVGTPLSTFTTGIQEIRKHVAVANAAGHLSAEVAAARDFHVEDLYINV